MRKIFPEAVQKCTSLNRPTKGLLVTEVPLAKIITGPQLLEPWRLLRALDGGREDPILLALFRCQYYLIDGNHRFWVARIGRKQTIKAWVVTVPG